MSTAKHTPGPWKASELERELDYGDTAILRSDGVGIAYATAYDFYREIDIDGATVLANASLIAAAPDLLEACRATELLLCEVWDVIAPLVGPEQVNAVADAVRSAIAKSEGR